MEIATILSFLGAGCAGLLMLAVALRARRSVPRWLFTAGLGASALERLFSGLSLNSASADGKAYWETWRLLALSCLPGVWSYFSMIYARGPSRELPARRKALLLILSVSPILFALVYRERMLAYIGQLGVDFPWMFGLTRAGTSLYILVLIGAVVVLMNLERTYRASVGTMRWRIKFMILGLAVLFVARAYTSAQALIFHAINLRLDVVDSAALLLACLLILRTLSRTGHFEVTVYPSQAVLRSSVTMLLAGVYLVVVGALAKVISYLPGKASFEAKAFLALVALVVLAILLMSDRLRLRTRTFVSRHFSRPLHDYPQVWRTFAAGTARCLEPSALCEGIVKAISDIFQALSVTIWLLDESKEKLTFMASTSLFKTEATGTGLEAEETTQLITALREQHEPMDIDRSTEPWAAALRSLHPDQFRRGGHRVCVPVAAGGDLLGIIMVGDRVGGALYEVQDLELLKAVAEQAGAGLLNLQLAEKLSEAKQLEAFRAMAAFFVHDLKNTTSTLTLMLKNLPVHFKDPVFREEALVDIARTAKQLEELISRLNLLRQELKVASVECDLNQLVTDALKGQELAPGIVLVKDLRPVPKLLLDPLQIQTVITNLILNARDAVGNSGRILVETRSSDSRVTLAVSDNGCGMAPEFIHEHLFRPFQTTKRNGIGIGMFHCKMIVDAHRGRIDVESRKGSGTTFRVSFPCRSESSHSFLDLRSEPAITRSGAAAQKRLQLDCRRAESPALGLV